MWGSTSMSESKIPLVPAKAGTQADSPHGSPPARGRAVKLMVLSLLLVATPALAASPDEAAAGRVLDAFHAAAARSDFKAYFDLFTPDGVFIGTDAAERWPVPQFKGYAKAPFAAGKGWVYTPRSRHVTIAPVACRCVAYFDELLDSKSYGTSRGTGVLLKGPHGWKIAQYALTFPIPNDLAKDMTDRIKAHEAVNKEAAKK